MQLKEETMNTIIKNYKSQIKRFREIESKASVDEVHDKRVILRRIFPILLAYKIRPRKVKNGQKAFKLFGKLRDTQVQILKLESIDQTSELTEYTAYLKKKEEEQKDIVRKFSKKKKLEFPSIKKKLKLNKSKILAKADKSLNKLIDRIHSRSIDDARDIHEIRIAFKKFRYNVEILSYIENIDASKIDMLKIYQDKLGEIQDYEVLIDGIKKYCKKRQLDAIMMIELFEQDQNTLIENFDNQIELFMAVCRDVLVFDTGSDSPEDNGTSPKNTRLIRDQLVADSIRKPIAAEEVREIIDSLMIRNNPRNKKNEETGTGNNKHPASGKKQTNQNAVPVDSGDND